MALFVSKLKLSNLNQSKPSGWYPMVTLSALLIGALFGAIVVFHLSGDSRWWYYLGMSAGAVAAWAGLRWLAQRPGKNLVAIALLFGWYVFFWVWVEWVSQRPLETEIALSRIGHIEERIFFPVRDRYIIDIEFSRAGINWDGFRSLTEAESRVRSAYVNPDIAMPIQWSLRSDTGEIIASDSGPGRRVLTTSGTSVKSFDTAVKIGPGWYDFTAQSTDGIEAAEGTKGELVVHLSAKHSGFGTFSFTGAILNFMVLPLIGITAAAYELVMSSRMRS